MGAIPTFPILYVRFFFGESQQRLRVVIYDIIFAIFIQKKNPIDTEAVEEGEQKKNEAYPKSW